MKMFEVKIGKVEKYLYEKMSKGPIHLTLMDPENINIESACKLAKEVENRGSSAIMVGGSTIYSTEEIDFFIKEIKKEINIPIIVFPNNINAVSKYADAIFFMSLLNSVEWYYIIGAQAQGALLIKKYKIEPIPLGYIVFNSDTAVAAMGRVIPLPPSHGEVAVTYALAAQYLGMRLVYLEAGSGAREPIPPKTINIIKKVVEIPIIVGGGIRDSNTALELIKAGANAIVTGTIAEEHPEKLFKIIETINKFK
jgi:phosphoglycerol geranylgeranyltransferase